MKDLLGPYRILSLLGHGGMGSVYLGVHDHLGREIAVKALAPELTRHPAFKERFFAEARTQARLQHTNIVTLYDLIEDEGGFFIVMEYVPGETLEAALAKENGAGWSLDRSLFLFQQILAGLDYAHSKGVIHRDVKSSNVMIAEGDLIKLTDFGIALLIGDKRLTASHSTIGTPVYMSPEQILRPRSVDHRTDIYSAAIVLFEMLCGKPPFDADTEYEIKKLQIETAAPDPRAINPEIPERIAEALAVALRKDPEERFQSAGAFSRALSAEQAPVLPFRAPPPPEPAAAFSNPPAAAAPAVRSRRFSGRGVTAAVVAAFLLASLGLAFHRGASRPAASRPQVAAVLPAAHRPAETPEAPMPAPLPDTAGSEPAPVLMSQPVPSPEVKSPVAPAGGDARESGKADDRKAGNAFPAAEIRRRLELARREVAAGELPAARRRIDALRILLDDPRTGLEKERLSLLALEESLLQAVQAEKARARASATDLHAQDTPVASASPPRAVSEESRSLEPAAQRPRQVFRIERVEIQSALVQQSAHIVAIVHVTVDPPLSDSLWITVRAQILKNNAAVSLPTQKDVSFPANSPSLKIGIPINVPSRLFAGEYYLQTDFSNASQGIQSREKNRFHLVEE